MIAPRHPLGPAFDKAADAPEAWRQQQSVALTQEQRAIFEDARRKSAEREKAKAAELEKRRQSDIEEAIRKRRLAKPQLDLHPRIKGTTLEALVARKFAEEQHQDRPKSATVKLEAFIEREIRRYATAEVERAHARERELLRQQEQEKLDSLLRSFEQARNSADRSRGPFVRAAIKGKASHEFAKGSGNYAVPKSDAIARAVAKVKAKEEEERTRGDRDKGRGRSLSNTFNKVR